MFPISWCFRHAFTDNKYIFKHINRSTSNYEFANYLYKTIIAAE